MNATSPAASVPCKSCGSFAAVPGSTLCEGCGAAHAGGEPAGSAYAAKVEDAPHYIRVVTGNEPARVYDFVSRESAAETARQIVDRDFEGTTAQIFEGRSDEGRDADPVEVVS